MQANNTLVFSVNGFKRELNFFDPRQSVLDYLRTKEGLKGVKLVCGQGGCGACTVVVTRFDYSTGKFVHVSVNACLMPIASLADCNVTTTEGLGSTRAGFHAVQERIAKYGGSQCGYCTPGMVMAMYGLLQAKEGKPTAKDVDALLDGNICRCTGYRPIIKACHSFAVDCKESCTDIDIEDIGKKVSPYEHKSPHQHEHKSESLHFHYQNVDWYRPASINEVFEIRNKHHGKKVRYVVGNTATGYTGKDLTSEVFIDTSVIPELNKINEHDGTLTVGASVRISTLMEELKKRADKSHTFETLVKHIKCVASVHVRNNASWVGNLMLARGWAFPSDIATILYGIGAKVLLKTKEGDETLDIAQLLSRKEDDFLVVEINIPFAQKNQIFNTFRSAIRPKNSAPLINAAFSVTLNEDTISSATLVFGAIDKVPKRAKNTEAILNGKKLLPETFQEALKVLSNEIVPVHREYYKSVEYPEGKEQFRSDAIQKFFYKYFLQLLHSAGKLQSSLQHSIKPSELPVMKGKQDFVEKPDRPAVPKIEANIQASGEAQYTSDIPAPEGTLYGYLLLSKKAGVKLVNIDYANALKQSNVVAVITAEDIKGSNDIGLLPNEEQLFTPKGGNVPCVGHPLALLVAQDLESAEAAAKKINVEYGENYDGKPVFSIKDAYEQKKTLGAKHEIVSGDVSEGLKSSENVLKGEIKVGSQHPFYLERIAANAIPGEDGHLTVQCGTQNTSYLQQKLAANLGVPTNKVTVTMKRCGGGFGGRLTRYIPVPIAAAVATAKIGKPVRVQLSIQQDLDLTAGRHDLWTKYTAGFNSNGVIQALELEVFANSGFSHDMSVLICLEINEALDDVYYFKNFRAYCEGLKTNIQTRTATRSFGKSQAKYIIETVIEHVASKLGKTPEEIRMANLYTKNNCITPGGQHLDNFTIPQMFDKLSKQAQLDERQKQINEFNKTHKWKKRGISMIGLKYGIHQAYAAGVHATITFNGDGSVTVMHGSSEIGTGVNTKVVQVVANTLGITVDKVRIAEINTEHIAQTGWAGGSVGSEGACEAARKAALILKKRLAEVKEDLWKASKDGIEPTWEQVAAVAANKLYVQTSTSNFVPLGEDSRNSLVPWQKHFSNYHSYAVGVSEVELDILTGEVEVLRADLIEDVGNSLNPLIDIGQIEGAYVFGLGYFIQEEVLISPEDGSNNSNDTWDYKPPIACNIPNEFNTELLAETNYPKANTFGLKAVGEPPMVLAYGVAGAIRQAIFTSRAERGLEPYIRIDSPITIDRRVMACDVKPEHFNF